MTNTISNATPHNYVGPTMGNQKTKIKNNEHILPFGITHIERVIKDQEQAIAALAPKVQETLISFKEKEKEYLDWKELYEMENGELETRKQILEAHVRMRDNIGNKKLVRVLRSTSSLDQKRTHPGKEFEWIGPAAKVLAESNTFLTKEELFSRIMDAHPDIAKKLKSRPNLPNFKMRVERNLLQAAEKAPTRKHGKSLIVAYKGKIGLPTWVDDKFEPKPEYKLTSDKLGHVAHLSPHKHSHKQSAVQ